MQAEVFYIHQNGEQRGPYTMRQVNHMYKSAFIDDDTLYWREGMEQWHPVTEIVERRRKRNRLMFWGIILGVMAAFGLFGWMFGEVTLNAWREMTSGEYTAESAWWRARGLVRGQLADNAQVTFYPFDSGKVKLHDGNDATVELGGTVYQGSGQEPRAWEVRLRFDPLRGEWGPAPAQKE
jgi:hypothetical protein